MKTLVYTGIGLNIAASILIDAFYHPDDIGFGWSTFGNTAWTMRFVGVAMLVVASVLWAQKNEGA